MLPATLWPPLPQPRKPGAAVGRMPGDRREPLLPPLRLQLLPPLLWTAVGPG